MRRIHDITPTITNELAVFPGDTQPSREILLDIRQGAHVTLSTLHATVHLGAHIDGPCHYGRDASGVDQVPLERCLGPCQVMHVDVARGARIEVADLPDPITAPRVLMRTGTFPDPNAWNDDFAAIAPDLVDHLADQGVELLGIDTPSVDLATAKELIAHHRFLARDVTILEGVVLDGIAAGVYELVALPLKLAGFDGSPVRAILIER